MCEGSESERSYNNVMPPVPARGSPLFMTSCEPATGSLRPRLWRRRGGCSGWPPEEVGLRAGPSLVGCVT